MSRGAWAYVGFVILLGVLLAGLGLAGSSADQLISVAFPVLLTLATLAQLLKVKGPSYEAWHINLIFLFAGVILLSPGAFVLLVLISHGIEWGKERLTNSGSLRSWYIQPFNVAVHILAGSAARWAYSASSQLISTTGGVAVVVGTLIAAVAYVVINHLLIGQALVLARKVSWEESGVLALESLATDFVMVCLGSVVAYLWEVNHWLILFALSPLALMRRALMIPQLKRQAQTDPKTGLWNADQFREALTTELERAKRFARPLAVMMADLDLLRNINNTYGHLAGDTVLIGTARIIRETIRQYDVAARFGGEEFAIILPEADESEARAIAERIRRTMESTSFDAETSDTAIRATISIGVACFPSDAKLPNDLVHEADVAVYQAKLQGRNAVVCASALPRSAQMAQDPIADRFPTAYAAAHASRKRGSDPDPANAKRPSREPLKDRGRIQLMQQVQNGPAAWLWVFVAAVVVAGVGALVLLSKLAPDRDPIAIGMLTGMALVAQLPQVKNLYGESSVSVSVAIVFAAALISGLPGAAVVSAGVVLAHSLRARPAVYKVLFNWATHVLAASAPAFVFNSHMEGLVLGDPNVLGQVGRASIAGLMYFGIETGLISLAIGLSKGVSPLSTWTRQYKWMTSHYVVLCVGGLFLSLAYEALGALGIIAFALPVLMMHYVQKQYIGRTQDSVRELERMNQELGLANDEIMAANTAIRELNEELFHTLAKIIDARDPFVRGHAAKVADYAVAIAAELGLPTERTEGLRLAGLLHDIGKIGVPERILQKPGKLTAEEYRTVKKHAALGGEFLETSRGLRHLVPFVRHHHERWAGGGYPDRLEAEQIPLEARILAVCDAVEAMASDRPYHKAMSVQEVLRELDRCSGTQFDPTVAKAFVRVAERREATELVINSAAEVLGRKATGGEEPGLGGGWIGPQRAPADRIVHP